MSHLVRFRTTSGEFSTEEVADLDAAVARVEVLRNDERADDVRVFAEVPLHFETYVKVSLATPAPAPEPESEPVAPEPVADPDPEPVAEVMDEPVAEAMDEPVDEVVEATPPPPPAPAAPPAPVEPPPGAMLLTPVASANGDDSRTGLFGRS